MAAQTKEVFNPKHIIEYIKAIELKCTEKKVILYGLQKMWNC